MSSILGGYTWASRTLGTPAARKTRRSSPVAPSGSASAARAASITACASMAWLVAALAPVTFFSLRSTACSSVPVSPLDTPCHKNHSPASSTAPPTARSTGAKCSDGIQPLRPDFSFSSDISIRSSVAQAAVGTVTQVKFLNQLQRHLHHGHHHQLANPLPRLNADGFIAAIPAGNFHLALVIAVDQADQIAQHQTLLVAQARTRQQHGGKAGVADMNGQARWQQSRLARLEHQRLINAGAQIHSGRTGRGVFRQRPLAAQTGVQHPGFKSFHWRRFPLFYFYANVSRTPSGRP